MGTGERLILAMLLLLASARAAETAPADAKTSAAIPAGDVEQFLMDTEIYLRPTPAERWMILSHELEARGLDRAARELRARIQTRDLVVELLRLGQASAAAEVAESLQRENPREAQAALLVAVALYAQGSYELAGRALANAEGARPPELVRVLGELVRFQSTSNQPLSADHNPWHVAFKGDSGQFEPATLASSERAKLPPEAARGLLELVRLLPTSGPLWALLGEVLNAEGNVSAARASLERARALGQTPRVLVDHARILKEHDDAKRRQADQAMSSAPAGASQNSAESAGWAELGSRPRVLMVIVIGAAATLGILILQFRQWFRPHR